MGHHHVETNHFEIDLNYWPVRSPDLRRLNYFLWRYVKEMVNKTQPTTRDDMKIRIINAYAAISTETIAFTINSLCCNRLQKCLRVGGEHFEHQM
ncbi:hypothetical protein WH47_01565 [Habropoda laboriosa]|uniref:Histone-lysine N-methyltransferase SETMAR n=1 Tax=Habropoda laboriosa TaxID=597456 RepID=A0A0L7R0L5_9HYME|nr:hypothetical protein WH47_01565 [Habropoda laboriosa]